MKEVFSPSTTTPTEKEARSTQRLRRPFAQPAPLSVCFLHHPSDTRQSPGPSALPPFPHRAMVKPVLALLPVLGLTWLFGLLVHISPTWAYAAVLLNSFQVCLGPEHTEWGLWNVGTQRGNVVYQD